MSIYHFAHVWQNSDAKGSTLLVLLALAEAADAEGLVRASRQSIADRARVTTSTAYAAMAALFKSGELMRYDAEAPDSALCIVVCSRGRDKTEACDIPNSGIRKFEADDAGCDVSDFRNLEERGTAPRQTEEKNHPFDAVMDDDAEFDDGDLLEDVIKAAARMGPPDVIHEPLVEAVQIAPPPPPRRMIPKHLPPGDLGLVLAALGVEEDMRGPLFWYRREHRADLDAVLAGLGRIGAADLARMITEKGVKAPDLDRVSTILKLLKRR